MGGEGVAVPRPARTRKHRAHSAGTAIAMTSTYIFHAHIQPGHTQLILFTKHAACVSSLNARQV